VYSHCVTEEEDGSGQGIKMEETWHLRAQQNGVPVLGSVKKCMAYSYISRDMRGAGALRSVDEQGEIDND
jgi:hypothetical protein